MPLFDINHDKCFIVEKMIDKVTFDHEAGFDFIIKDFTRIFKNKNILSYQYVCQEKDIEGINKFFSCYENNNKALKLSENIKKFIDKGYYKKCISHGDLYYNNLIFDGEKFYYIDFECVNDHFFVFDILFYIFFESFRWENDLLITNYFNGVYDQQLEDIFKLNAVEYDKELKKTYLFIILFEYYGYKIPIWFADKYLL